MLSGMSTAPEPQTPPTTSEASPRSSHRSAPSLSSAHLAKRVKVTVTDSTMASSSEPAVTAAAYPPGLALALDQEINGTGDSAAPTDAGPRHQPSLAGEIPLQVKLLSAAARAPTRGSAHAAGYDLYVCEDGVVPAHGQAMLSTGISIAIPPGTYGRVAPRSGLAAKHGLATGAGVVDYDYRGEVKLILFNHSSAEFKVSAGDRMAQLVLERIVTPPVVVVDELDGTDRGTGGFGSTGGFGAIPVDAASQLPSHEEFTGPEALVEDMDASELTAATVGGV